VKQKKDNGPQRRGKNRGGQNSRKEGRKPALSRISKKRGGKMEGEDKVPGHISVARGAARGNPTFQKESRD